MQSEHLRAGLSSRPNPLIFRGLAVFVSMCAIAVDVNLGGAWLGVWAAAMLVVATCFVFPAKKPNYSFQNGALAILRSIRLCPLWLRVCCALLLVLAASGLEYFGDFTVGGAFNIFLVSIYFASLLFGLRVALLAWLISVVSVEYCAISPRYSFAIVSLKDFSELIIFFYLGLMAMAAAHLVRASAVLDGDG